MSFPKVSVVVPSYNHEKFIPEALESILHQTFTDYEILIVDDASKDHSSEVIKDFIDQHQGIPMQFCQHEVNQGGVITLNDLIKMASGEYIALLNSDDIWLPNKLETQVNFLDEHPEIGAVFTQAKIVDENLEEVSDELLPAVVKNVFFQKNRSRGAWFRHFFFQQNCLCHPSILIRRSVYDEIGLYDPRYRQVPDFQMWTRYLKQHTLSILEEPMVLLRWHKSNTSVINSANSIRGLNEFFFLYRDFFQDMPDDVFVDGFQKYFKNPEAREPAELECEKAFLYFIPTGQIRPIYHNIGLEHLYRLMGNPETAEVLAEKYQFRYNDFFSLGGENAYDGSLPAAYAPALQHIQAPAAPANAPSFEGPAPAFTPPQRGIKFAIGEILIKVPGLYYFARAVYRRLMGKPQ